jgi:adenylate kinase family enzyme
LLVPDTTICSNVAPELIMGVGDVMRIVVTGTSGAGKTTLARTLAARLDLPHIDLDAINWQPDWHDLLTDDPGELRRLVTREIEADAWVTDGYYPFLQDVIWSRATHLIWLDYSRAVIMWQVIGRSVYRAVARVELWPGTGNRETWLRWLHPSHPIRWSWRSWQRQRAETEARLGRPDVAHLVVLRARHRREARATVERLATETRAG